MQSPGLLHFCLRPLILIKFSLEPGGISDRNDSARQLCSLSPGMVSKHSASFIRAGFSIEDSVLAFPIAGEFRVRLLSSKSLKPCTSRTIGFVKLDVYRKPAD